MAEEEAEAGSKKKGGGKLAATTHHWPDTNNIPLFVLWVIIFYMCRRWLPEAGDAIGGVGEVHEE